MVISALPLAFVWGVTLLTLGSMTYAFIFMKAPLEPLSAWFFAILIALSWLLLGWATWSLIELWRNR